MPGIDEIEAKETALQEKNETVLLHMMNYNNLLLDNLILVIALLQLLFKLWSLRK